MSGDVQPLVRQTTCDQIVDEVRRQIWDGELQAGDRLTQEDLASAMGVSRIPVREALISLTHMGVVSMEAHQGAFVLPLDEAAITDHYDLYAHVDGFAITKLIERGSGGALARLCAQTADIDDVDRLFTHVAMIRARIHELGGSPRFAAVARGLVGIVPGNFFAQVPGSADVARRHFGPIAEALAAGDPAEATEAYRSMLTEHAGLVLEVQERRSAQ